MNSRVFLGSDAVRIDEFMKASMCEVKLENYFPS